MNNLHIKGKFNEAKGKIKEQFGHATGNDSTEVKGFGDRIKGKIQKVAGDFKDKLKNKADKELD